jgi:hypothetical protein
LNLLLHEVQSARAAVGLARVRARTVLPQTGRLLRHIRQLPVLHVVVSDSHAGRNISSALNQRRGLVPSTLAAAVLELPEQPQAYLVGRSMQAVRTGINHARRQGLSVVYVTDDGERGARALELAGGKVGADFGAPLQAWAAAPLGESWFTLDAAGVTCAIAILVVDGPIARLDTMISAQGELRSPARYLLLAHVFMELIGRGVTHVILENSLFLPPGLLHFQKLLGFKPMNIRLSQRDGQQSTIHRLSDRALVSRDKHRTARGHHALGPAERVG